MCGALEILIVSVELLWLYMQATCRIILLRGFGHGGVASVVGANRPYFSFVSEALQEPDLRIDYPRSCTNLKSDLLALTLLLKVAWKARERLSKGERLLIHAGFVLLLIIVHNLR
jgi:hypothetical protein